MTERQKSDRREEWLAKELGGKRVAGSGSSREKKGDVKFGHFLMEDKRTAGKSLAIQVAWLEKIEREALACGKTPVFSFGFDKCEQDWVAFPLWWVKSEEWWEEFRK